MRTAGPLVLLLLLAPAAAAAQSSPTRNRSQEPISIEVESEAATTLYLVGSTTLVLGAGASVGLGLASVEVGLDGLFSPGYSPGPSDALEAAAIGVGCAAGAIGLLLLGIAIHFDVESGERRRARDALSLRF